MKNKNKGFTLIELLVVVAIIGILAAVGTVAYTGYTAGAKKSTTKSNHASVVKYIAAEDQKCNIGEDTAMTTASTPLTCAGRDGDAVIVSALLALSDFKNPYAPDQSAVIGTAKTPAKSNMGYTLITAAANVITVSTCFEDDCADATDDYVGNDIHVAE